MSFKVSLIDGHIDGTETCVICGKDIPEGSQVCGTCIETEEKDVVDIIRCKECGKYSRYENAKKGWCYLHERETLEHNFCEYGRKKSEVQGE